MIFPLLVYLIFDVFHVIFLRWENLLISCLYYYLFCRRWNKNFVVQFLRIRPLLYPSKHGKDAVYEGKNAKKGVCFPAESAFLLFK